MWSPPEGRDRQIEEATMFEMFPRPEKISEMKLVPHEVQIRRALAKPHYTGIFGYELKEPEGAFGVGATAFGVAMLFLPGFDDIDIADRMARYQGMAWACWGRERAMEASIELMKYLNGDKKKLETPVDVSYCTPFQQDVYRALTTVPWGETITYGELADLAGHRGKALAVGSAMRHNPCPIFVPCHRVIAASGKLGGWSGPPGWKEALLEHEGILAQRDDPDN